VINVMRRMRDRYASPPRLGVAFVVALTLLLGSNVFWLARRQATKGSCAEKVCLSPRALEKVAWKSRNAKISYLALYYLLNERIPHSRLTIPRSWRSQKAQFEEISRVRVQISKKRLLIDSRHLDGLLPSGERRERTLRGDVRFARTENATEGAIERYIFLFDEGITDYVVAESREESGAGPIFVISLAAYAKTAVR
jgi:hypothetical protein